MASFESVPRAGAPPPDRKVTVDILWRDVKNARDRVARASAASPYIREAVLDAYAVLREAEERLARVLP